MNYLYIEIYITLYIFLPEAKCQCSLSPVYSGGLGIAPRVSLRIGCPGADADPPSSCASSHPSQWQKPKQKPPRAAAGLGWRQGAQSHVWTPCHRRTPSLSRAHVSRAPPPLMFDPEMDRNAVKTDPSGPWTICRVDKLIPIRALGHFLTVILWQVLLCGWNSTQKHLVSLNIWPVVPVPQHMPIRNWWQVRS